MKVEKSVKRMPCYLRVQIESKRKYFSSDFVRQNSTPSQPEKLNFKVLKFYLILIICITRSEVTRSPAALLRLGLTGLA